MFSTKVYKSIMDEKDRKIISILQQNGKAKLSQIAEKMGMSAMGVKKGLTNWRRGKLNSLL